MKTSSVTQKQKVIAVLMGGWNGEREVSLTSAAGCLKVFHEMGYHAIGIDVTQDIPQWMNQLIALKPDVIFVNALHGRWVEDGCIQGLLEMLGFPYTNSGVMASALAMDKRWSRHLFEQQGLPIPAGKSVPVSELLNTDHYPYPYVVKPINQGSSLGVTIVHSRSDLVKAAQEWNYGDDVLVEEYIPGREISVAVMGDRALGALELEPVQGFYDYKAKYTDGACNHFMPARMPHAEYQLAMDIALKAAQALGCEGVSRADFRFDDLRHKPGKLYLLEVNTQPGMTPLSIVPEIAAHANISFGELLEWMINNPVCPEENKVIKKQREATAEAEDRAEKDLVLSFAPAQ
jgi:D-alanine-D-alanine ligase